MEAVTARPRNNSWIAEDRPSRAPAEPALEFGRFRVLLRQRQLVADGVPIELGTRALDLLLVLLETDGSLVSKDELMSRVWPGIVVAEENLKTQIFALRKALGEDRDFIRTEFGRGYRLGPNSLDRHPECLRDATEGPVEAKIGFPTDFSAIAAWLARSEVKLADASIVLQLRALHPAETGPRWGPICEYARSFN